MNSDVKKLYAQVKTAHWAVCTQLAHLEHTRRGQDGIKEYTDCIYALKEAAKLIEDLRKRVNAGCKKLEFVVTEAWTRDPEGEPIRTDYCTGSPDVKISFKMPKKGTKEYAALCAHFGVPPDAPFAPHWNRMFEQITAEMAQGKPAPAGCDTSETYSEARVTIKKRRPVLDEGESVDVQGPEALVVMYEIMRRIAKCDVLLHTPQEVADLIENCRDMFHAAIRGDSDEPIDDAPAIPATVESEEDPF